MFILKKHPRWQRMFMASILVVCACSGAIAAEKGEFDAGAEAKQAAKEDADQAADHVNGGESGKYQKLFHGAFMVLEDADKAQQPNPDVVGTFITDNADKNPGKTYLVKADGNKPQIVEMLKKSTGKRVLIEGKLRNEEKYLVVLTVTETAGSAPPKKRGGRGGI